LRLAEEKEVLALTGAKIGYAGIVNLPKDIVTILDDSLEGLCNFETGSNKTGYHSINVNFGRDVPQPKQFYDIKVAREGDLEPATGQPMETHRAVEVGNIFPLETKYTDALDVFYTDENGHRQSIIMGCYGIGITRLMGVIVEHFADERGIVWPESIAPAKVHLVRIGDSANAVKQADELYSVLTQLGISILYDNRNMRPGEKFADADLIGIPHRVVVSEKTAADKSYEYKARTDDVPKLLHKTQLLSIFST
jgi:prolyl-tRNA synthetase